MEWREFLILRDDVCLGIGDYFSRMGYNNRFVERRRIIIDFVSKVKIIGKSKERLWRLCIVR